MKKQIRIILYALSVISLMALILLAVFGRDKQRTVETGMDQADTAMTETEEIQTAAEAGEIQQSEAEEESGTEEEPETEEEPGAEQENETEAAETTLLFAGDVMLCYQSFLGNYRADGIEGVLSGELLSKMQEADILMVNNEFAFSNRGTPAEDKQYTFRCDPGYVSALNEMGVDIVTLANNHSLDYGKEALSDTFTTLDEAGILYAGAGESIDRAKELQIIEKNGMKFGFLAASRVIPVVGWDVRNSRPGMLTAYDDTILVEEIQAAQEKCDFLTVYLHWGIERDAYPQQYQTKIASDCFAAGADLVVGAHSHCLQGIEFMDGKPVFYSLGNFIFSSVIERTALLQVTLGTDGSVAYSMIPARAADGKTIQLEGAEAESVYSYMQEISVNAKVDENGKITEE